MSERGEAVATDRRPEAAEEAEGEADGEADEDLKAEEGHLKMQRMSWTTAMRRLPRAAVPRRYRTVRYVEPDTGLPID